MKITVVCDVTGAEDNGAAVAALSLIRSMKQRGHEVAVVCTDETKKGREGYVVMPRSAGTKDNNGASHIAIDKPALEAAVWDSDVVHIMTLSAVGAAAAKLCRQHCIPASADCFITAESIISRFLLKDVPLADQLVYRRLDGSIFRSVDAVRFPSESLRGTFEKAVGREVRSYVIPNGVGERFVPDDTKKPCEFRNKFIILYCAAYQKGKNHSVLIDAVAMSGNNSRIQLIFAGDGPMKRALRHRSDKLANKPLFAAFPHNLMSNVYNYADLYVHPAVLDADAAACMEALACGKVPIVSDSPLSGARRFPLDDRNLFRYRDPRDLADKIDWFIGHPDSLEEYRERYQGIAAELSREQCMDRIEEMFYEIHG